MGPLGEIPNQPGVDGTGNQIARFGSCPSAGHVVQNPTNLWPTEVSRERQTGLGPEPIRIAEFVNNAFGASVLPHDGVVDRLTTLSVPHNGGFALLRDTDRLNVLYRNRGLGQRSTHNFTGVAPNLHRIVFHPAGLRKDLPVLYLTAGNRLPIMSEQDRPG